MTTTAIKPAFHGGQSFEAIGVDFSHLERATQIINADVLDAWFPPSPRVLAKLSQFQSFLAKTSPPTYAPGLIQAIAHARDLPPSAILPGGGSSGLIFTCLPRWISNARRVLILDPMYGEYRHLFEEVMDLETTVFPLDKNASFQIDTYSLITHVNRIQPDVIALVNPNSPTGQLWPRRDVLRFLNNIPPTCKVILDETYIEYAGAGHSLESEAVIRPNLLVVKSMSKVYALSGLRVAYLVAHPSTIRSLGKWMPPWAVSLPAQVAAIEALRDPAHYERQYVQTHELRNEMYASLAAHPSLRVHPSVANFLLVEIPRGAQQTVELMSRQNIFVRNGDSMFAEPNDRFLRIAVKPRVDNHRIVDAMFETIDNGQRFPRKEGKIAKRTGS